RIAASPPPQQAPAQGRGRKVEESVQAAPQKRSVRPAADAAAARRRPPSQPQGKGNNRLLVWVGAGVGGVALVGLVVVGLLLALSKREEDQEAQAKELLAQHVAKANLPAVAPAVPPSQPETSPAQPQVPPAKASVPAAPPGNPPAKAPDGPAKVADP